MSPEERKANRARVDALLLRHDVIASEDQRNESRELMLHAIAKASVSAQIELMRGYDYGDE